MFTTFMSDPFYCRRLQQIADGVIRLQENEAGSCHSVAPVFEHARCPIIRVVSVVRRNSDPYVRVPAIREDVRGEHDAPHRYTALMVTFRSVTLEVNVTCELSLLEVR